MLSRDSVIPQFSRTEKAAFQAELIFLSNIEKNSDWDSDFLNVSSTLIFSSSLLDEFLSSVFPKTPDSTFIGLFEKLSHHAYSVGLVLMNTDKTEVERGEAFHNCRIDSYEKITSILDCLPITAEANARASAFIINIYDATTKELLRHLAGRVVWDEYAWQCLAPESKKLN